MGTFEHIKIGENYYQTKALEFNILKNDNSNIDKFEESEIIEPGDYVEISRKAISHEEHKLAPQHYYSPQPTNYSVEIINEKDLSLHFVSIVDNKLTANFEKDVNNCFNISGNSIGETQWEPLVQEDENWLAIKAAVRRMIDKE